MSVKPVTRSLESTITRVDGKATATPVISREVLNAILFSRGPYVPGKAPCRLSGLASNSAFVISDMTSLYRCSQDVAAIYLEQHPTSSLQWLSQLISSNDVAAGYHAFGTASGVGAFIGCTQIPSDLENIAYADAIEDHHGSLLGRISAMKSATLIGAGMSFAVFRPLGVISSIKKTPYSGFNAPTLLGRVTYGFLFAGMMFYAVFFSLLSALFGINVYDGAKFKSALGKASGLEEKLKVLQEKIEVDPKAILVNLETKYAKKGVDDVGKAVQDELLKEAFASAKVGLCTALEELGIEIPNDERLQEITKRMMGKVLGSNDPDAIATKLAIIGLELRAQKETLAKDAKLSRVLGKDGILALTELQNAIDLIGRVSRGDPEAIALGEKLVGAVEKSVKSKLKVNILVLAVLVAGIVSMHASTFFVAGAGLLFAAVLMLAFSIAMTAVDAYYLIQSYKNEQPAAYDKKLLLGSSMLGLASLASILTLHGLGVITLGVFPLVIALSLTVLWLGQNGISWAIMNRNERLLKEKNPTLESLLELIEAECDELKLQEVLQNLPEEMRAYFPEEGNLKEKVLNAIKAAEKVKEQNLEQVRQALMPFLIG